MKSRWVYTCAPTPPTAAPTRGFLVAGTLYAYNCTLYQVLVPVISGHPHPPQRLAVDDPISISLTVVDTFATLVRSPEGWNRFISL
jgi:hypothetical protein